MHRNCSSFVNPTRVASSDGFRRSRAVRALGLAIPRALALSTAVLLGSIAAAQSKVPVSLPLQGRLALQAGGNASGVLATQGCFFSIVSPSDAMRVVVGR